MPEWVSPVVSVVFTAAACLAMWKFLMAHMTMCEDVAEIKELLNDMGDDRGSE